MDTHQLSLEINQLHADICGALADPNRILILYSLSEQPHTVSELSGALNISQPATSRHLKILRDSGLVTATRYGANVEYRLNDPRLIEALDILRAVLRDSLARRAQIMSESQSEA